MRRQRNNKTENNNVANDTQEPSEELPTLKEIIENRAIEGERPMRQKLYASNGIGWRYPYCCHSSTPNLAHSAYHFLRLSIHSQSL